MGAYILENKYPMQVNIKLTSFDNILLYRQN